ncbi:MAG TPA: patatin-like phospholipase family protein [Gemmatimonadales bacterium]|nr:patatin-like phospholipase family protein [Gemmatimonadales bacterium]
MARRADGPPTARRGRIGLALAGGGPEGAVYEIGALRALEEAIDGLDFNAVHTYVGVSAGAFLASALANGITPSQLARALVKEEPGEHPFVPETFFTPAYRELGRRSLMLPRLLADALLQFTRRPRDQTLLESLTRVADALPVGIFDNEPIRRYLKKIFSIKGRTDDFRRLAHQLIVVATDLESGEAVRFGEPGRDHVPISRAVQASTAFPGLYPPVTIDGRPCGDGVLLKTLHASVALEHGVGLLLCVNPLVPTNTTLGVARGELPQDALLRRGLPTVLSQAFRTLVHSRLEVGMAAYGTRFPEADVLLFEPETDEYQMFFTRIFSFSSRRAVCQVAYAATRRDLRRRRERIRHALARHDLRLRDDVLDDESRDLWSGVGVPDEPAARSRGRLAQAVAGLEAAVRGR